MFTVYSVFTINISCNHLDTARGIMMSILFIVKFRICVIYKIQFSSVQLVTVIFWYSRTN